MITSHYIRSPFTLFAHFLNTSFITEIFSRNLGRILLAIKVSVVQPAVKTPRHIFRTTFLRWKTPSWTGGCFLSFFTITPVPPQPMANNLFTAILWIYPHDLWGHRNAVCSLPVFYEVKYWNLLDRKRKKQFRDFCVCKILAGASR